MNNPRIVCCSVCGGEGKLYCGQYEDERDIADCDACEGTGGEIIETEPLTMEEALALDGEKLRQLTGEDHGPFEIEPCPSFDSDQTSVIAEK